MDPSQPDTLYDLLDELQKSIAPRHAGLVKKIRAILSENHPPLPTSSLTVLHEISMELSMAGGFDDLCRRAVELARQRLGFDRVGIWVMDRDDTDYLRGTFGVDEKGNLRDERQQRTLFSDQAIRNALLFTPDHLFIIRNQKLLGDHSNEVGTGERAAAGLWDGEKVIGQISIDNLLSKKHISDADTSVLVLFAQVLGHLTTLKRTEEALRQSEQRYRLLADNVDDVIWTMDLEARFTYISPSVLALRGYTPEEVMKQSLQEVVSPGSLAVVNEHYQELLKAAQSAESSPYQGVYEVEQPRKDGSTVWTEVSVRIIREDNGKIVGVLGVSRNITNRKKHELEDKKQAQLLAALFETGKALSSTLELDEMIDIMLDQLRKVVPYDAASVLQVENNRANITRMVGYDDLEPQYSEMFKKISFDINHTPNLKEILTNQKAFCIPDIYKYPGWQHVGRAHPFRSWLGAPVTSNEGVFAIISLDKHQPNFYNEEYATFLTMFASQVSLAFQNARLFTRARQRAEEAESLIQAGMAVSAMAGLEETIHRILEQLNRLVPFETASVLLRRGEEMKIVGQRGFQDPSVVLEMTFNIHESQSLNRIEQTHQVVIYKDAQSEDPAGFSQPPNDRIHGWMGVPLILQERLIGIFALDSSAKDIFTPEHSRLASAFASQFAITLENAHLFDELQEMATIDPVTGIYNRRYFLSTGSMEFARALRYGHPLSLIMVDIDHFKAVNDSFGHAAGDRVLEGLAKLCYNQLRSIDLLARFGGEEFTILLPETDQVNANEVAERLRDQVASAVFSTANQQLHITISLGVCTLSAGSQYDGAPLDGLHAMIDLADQAMYAAKGAGRNRVRLAAGQISPAPPAPAQQTSPQSP